MTAGPERMLQWQARRAARLAALSWLHTDTSGPRALRYVRNELLVAPGHEAAAREELTATGATASQITTEPAVLGFVRLIAPGADIAAATQALRARSGDAAAGPHHVFTSSPFEQGGPYGPPSAVGGWTLPAGPAQDAAVRIAVVDTGVWRDSPLPPAWYEATADDYDDTVVEESDTGHANFIAGVLMANTDTARVRIVKVLDANGICTETALATALLMLANSGIDIINLSLGGFSHDDVPPVLLRAALARVLLHQDCVIVAAAGNEASEGQPYWPAAFAGTALPYAHQVVSVAAHDGSALCAWSNTGHWVDLAAPGSEIVSTYVTAPDFPTGFARWSGTSFAAPFVVAAIASNRVRVTTIADAVAAVREQAAARRYGGYPGLG